MPCTPLPSTASYAPAPRASWCACAVVSKAFTCLTDPERRAYYDRTGHEDLASAQAARRSGGGPPGGGGGMYYQQEMDPTDLFNMMFPGMGSMFGRGPMGMNRPFPHHGAQHNPFAQNARAPRAEAANASRGLSGGLSAALRLFQQLSVPQKLVCGLALLQVVPVALSLIVWLAWALALGVPLYLVCREVVLFERRPLYAPLRCFPYVSDAVRAARPGAQTLLDLGQPMAAVVAATWVFVLETCRAVASV